MGFWEMLTGEQPGIITSILNYKNKGQWGEYLTTFALNHDNLTGHLRTMCNLYIPDKEKTTEIDVLMIHEKGFFVFESKNYSGWIFGDADAEKWTQCLPNKEKHQFYNPIQQNKTHIRALADFLQLPEKAFFSYIIFSERCELKSVPADTEAYTIVRRHRLLKTLRADLKTRNSCYTKEQVDDFVNKLESTTHVSDEEKRQHIQAIKDRTEGDVCPYCGEKLVLRQGKYGSFYGCSTYPKCKFIRKA
ncbi:DNA topoisomerase 1 [Peptococcaceae bacterium CEB3]|nr:DNA topoisomerase 1 [Peptococcaceae bacterium CEB3]